MGNKVDKMLSQLKEGVNSFVKEQLPVDSLVKKLRGQDCGCTNSGDGDAGDLSAVCVCVVGKSCGCDFQDEKRDGDCCDDLNGMYRVERKETNEAMGKKIDKMVSQLKEGVDSLVKEQFPLDSLVKKLRGQDCGCTNSGDGDAGDLSAVCVVGKSCGCDFQDEKRDGDCCDDLNGMYRVERKETNEVFVPVVPVTSTLTEVCYVPEADVPVVPVTSTLTEVCYVPEADVPVVPVTSTLTEVCYVPEADVPVVPVTSTLTEVCYVPEADVPVVPVTSTLTEVCYVPEADVPVVPVTSTLTEVCYVPEADVPVVPVTSTSMSLTEQDNVGSAFKPVAMDLKDLCLSVGAHEGNSKLDNCIQKFSMNYTCGASHIEFRCQENHQQGICTSTIIIGIGIDECQSDYSKSEPSRGRHFPLETEETCILDVKLLSEDDCGALDFACNVAASEPEAPLRGVCREGLLRQRVRSTAVLKKTVLDPIFLCGKRPHKKTIANDRIRKTERLTYRSRDVFCSSA
ncbi:ATP-dependent RNA helicase DHX29 [Biomphalaria glabrata]|nr:ATP-dependent RNA helicase DHX29 [Biomphalaria glabrata]